MVLITPFKTVSNILVSYKMNNAIAKQVSQSEEINCENHNFNNEGTMKNELPLHEMKTDIIGNQIISQSKEKNSQNHNLPNEDTMNIEHTLYEMKADIKTMTSTLLTLHNDFSDFFLYIKKVLDEAPADGLMKIPSKNMCSSNLLPPLSLPPPPPPPPPPPLPSFSFDTPKLMIKKAEGVSTKPAAQTVPLITAELLKQVKLRKTDRTKVPKMEDFQNAPLISIEVLRSVKLKSTKNRRKSLDKKKPIRCTSSPRTRNIHKDFGHESFMTPNTTGCSTIVPSNLLKKKSCESFNEVVNLLFQEKDNG